MGRGKIRLKNLPALIQMTFVSLLTAAAWLRPLPRSRQFMVSKLAVIAIAVFVLAQLGSRLRELLLDRSVSCSYICLTITPFVRAMPPRSLSDYEKFKMPSSRVKMLNHWILRRAGIHAITFPSAHVASALAAALVLLRLEPWVGLIFLGAALSIAMATVVGG